VEFRRIDVALRTAVGAEKKDAGEGPIYRASPV
jgi:hypothetical protein